MEEVVWLHEYRCFGWLISRDAYFSFVSIPGIGVEQVENDDYELWEQRAIDYDDESD